MKKIRLGYLHDHAVARITLDDGKGNVLDGIMMRELLDAFGECAARNDLKLITFEGAGKHFSFGASVEEHTKDKASSMLRTFHRIIYNVMEMGIVTLSKVSGQCLGGGLELTLVCNVLFADRTAKFGQPEITLGVFPPPASVILPLKIGAARAEELLITGRSMNAQEACGAGLVHRVCEDRDDMDRQAEEWIVKHILPKSASSLRIAVKAARSGFNAALRQHLPELEKTYLKKLMDTRDANEGITAFLEKRKPLWVNG